MVQATKSTRHAELFHAFWAAAHRVKALDASGDPVDRAALVVLRQVSEHAPIRLSDLGPHLLLDLSTISRQVRTLEERGLVQRSECAHDRRAFLLSPTERGRALLEDALCRRSVALSAALADWSAADVDRLIALLRRFADDLTPTAPHPSDTPSTTEERENA